MSIDGPDTTGISVPAGWDCLPLDKLIAPSGAISYGIVQPGQHDPNGVPIVRVNNVRGGRIDTTEVLRVSRDIESKYERTRLSGGEVLLSLVGTLGECAVVPPELAGWNVARAIAVIPLAADFDPRWVAYCLRSREVQALVANWATTTVQATLNLRDVRRLPVLLAPQNVRSAITRAMSVLDDQIEQNRRTSRSLERLARAIFQAWFVDFAPVQAKAAGERSFPGMPPAVFDAMPTRLVDTEIGPIPEGWTPGVVSDAADLSRAQLNPQDHPDELFDHFSIPAFDDGQNAAVEPGRAIKSNKFLLAKNCVLASKLNPRIPRVWRPPAAAGRRQIASTEFLVVVPRRGWDRDYLYCLFQQPGFRDSLAQGASGTSNSHQRLRPQDFLARGIVLPPEPLRIAFASLAGPMMQLCAITHGESRKLAELRDLLLPKLLSGEVRVEAEQRIRRAP